LESNLGKTNHRVHPLYFLVDLFSLSPGLVSILTLTPACSVFKVCKFQFLPIHPPPLGDFHTKALSPGAAKKDAEATKVQDEAEARPSVPVETKVVVPEDKADQETVDTGMAEKAKPSVPEALAEDIDYIF
jgi:hypothetical protein